MSHSSLCPARRGSKSVGGTAGILLARAACGEGLLNTTQPVTDRFQQPPLLVAVGLFQISLNLSNCDTILPQDRGLGTLKIFPCLFSEEAAQFRDVATI